MSFGVDIMPRKARIESKSGIYHIMLRGINRQQIFEDDEDFEEDIDIEEDEDMDDEELKKLDGNEEDLERMLLESQKSKF